jgi:hypothetical protein
VSLLSLAFCKDTSNTLLIHLNGHRYSAFPTAGLLQPLEGVNAVCLLCRSIKRALSRFKGASISYLIKICLQLSMAAISNFTNLTRRQDRHHQQAQRHSRVFYTTMSTSPSQNLPLILFIFTILALLNVAIASPVPDCCRAKTEIPMCTGLREPGIESCWLCLWRLLKQFPCVFARAADRVRDPPVHSGCLANVEQRLDGGCLRGE